LMTPSTTEIYTLSLHDALPISKGHLRLENAYEYRDDATCVVTIGGERTEKVFTPGDQFAAELIYFSDCILNDRTPEPSGSEGLRSEEHTSELQSLAYLVCRLLL